MEKISKPDISFLSLELLYLCVSCTETALFICFALGVAELWFVSVAGNPICKFKTDSNVSLGGAALNEPIPTHTAAAVPGPSFSPDHYPELEHLSACEVKEVSAQISAAPKSFFHSLKSQHMNLAVEALETLWERHFVIYLHRILAPRQ